MLKLLRTTRGLLTLAFVAMLAAACSAPKYYVFKTIKHTPVEESEKAGQLEIEIEEAVAINLEEAKSEEMAMASIKKTAAPVSLNEASEKINKSVEVIQPKKTSKLEQIKTAIQVRKEVKKALKEQKEMVQDPAPENNAKSQIVALLLAALIGTLGIHRFYLGYTTIGILQIITLGGCGIWALIDLVRIITGDLKPADGSDYDPEL
jgi:hypothetical protein